MSNFQKNLKVLASQYTQKQIAEKTGFSQSSINNYLTKSSEPSIQFLIALKNAFGICIDDFLFAEIETENKKNYDRFIGNYIVYYYNNNSYKGEVHTNLANTLNYGVISIVEDSHNKVLVYGEFMKDKTEAVKILKKLNLVKSKDELIKIHSETNNYYKGTLSTTQQSIYFDLYNKFNGDQCYMIFNNPPSNTKYVGGVGTVNTMARGREHNPCIQFIILSKNLIDKPDGEIYNCLKFDKINVNLDYAIKEMVDLFKRLFVEGNEISATLTENQKVAILQNKIEYHFNEILEANAFRFAKISNREDDIIYKLIKEGVDIEGSK